MPWTISSPSTLPEPDGGAISERRPAEATEDVSDGDIFLGSCGSRRDLVSPWPLRHRTGARRAGLRAGADEHDCRGGVGKEDLLADPSTAQNWLNGALSDWAGTPGAAPLSVELEPGDLERLRDFRDDLRRGIATPDGDSAEPGGIASVALPTVSLSMRWDTQGRVQPLPRGSSWRLVVS
ncbi:ABATE domain-containing protein [Streptomyces sp. NPDC048411]|uniref:ABATE domain-containing protein n=1 Tax=Streptomyces sp. NPDC048411 TaxID=3157206 RepID=UPI0034554704